MKSNDVLGAITAAGVFVAIVAAFSFILFLCVKCDTDRKDMIEKEETKISNITWEKYLNGNYQLRRFNVKEKTTTGTISQSSAWFFLVVGSYSSNSVTKTDTRTNVRLYFKNYDGRYEFLEIGLSMVDIKIVDADIVPYITFIKNDVKVHSYESCLANIKKVIIHCKEKDFGSEININDMR